MEDKVWNTAGVFHVVEAVKEAECSPDDLRSIVR